MLHQTAPTPVRAGFSLIELLVVIFIITVVVAITLPALGGARDAAKNAGTQSLLTEIAKASESFYLDQRRYPGAFSARDMGHPDNATRGMSGMENIMLDLAGGIVGSGLTRPTDFPNAVQVSPVDPTTDQDAADAALWVEPTLIGSTQPGANNKAYFTPQAKNFVAQAAGTGTSIAQFGSPGHTAAVGRPQLPDVVDNFGNPVLAWSLDESTNTPITQVQQFAQLESSSQSPARFYWNQNAAFLKATSLGKSRTNQTVNPRGHSLMGDGVSDADRRNAMAALLGNPNFPDQLKNDPVLPTAPRARLVFQTTGVDGYYLGNNERGAKRGGGKLTFGMHFFGGPGTTAAPRFTKDGKDVNQDVITEFDDTIVTVGS